MNPARTYVRYPNHSRLRGIAIPIEACSTDNGIYLPKFPIFSLNTVLEDLFNTCRDKIDVVFDQRLEILATVSFGPIEKNELSYSRPRSQPPASRCKPWLQSLIYIRS